MPMPFPPRFGMRNGTISVLALGIKFLESLTLLAIPARFFIAGGVRPVASYGLWVVGCPPRNIDHPLKEWLQTSRKAEWLGSGFDGVVATRTDQAQNRSKS